MASEPRSSAHDRRGPGRPVNGDRRTCAACGRTARFEERYAVATRGVTVREPAWVCRSCGGETFVRSRASSAYTAIEPRPIIAAASGAAAPRDALRELRRILADLRHHARSGRDIAGVVRRRTHSVLDAIVGEELVGVLAADADARIVDANAAACALTGASRAELVKLRLTDLFTEHPERFDRAWRRFLESGEFAGACRLRQRSGHLVTVECVAGAHVLPAIHVGAIASRRLLQSLA